MVTEQQQRAVQQFLERWGLSMPYHDIGPALNCIECNALCNFLRAFGDSEAADALLESHVETDEEGDDPEHLRLQKEITSNHSH